MNLQEIHKIRTDLINKNLPFIADTIALVKSRSETTNDRGTFINHWVFGNMQFNVYFRNGMYIPSEDAYLEEGALVVKDRRNNACLCRVGVYYIKGRLTEQREGDYKEPYFFVPGPWQRIVQEQIEQMKQDAEIARQAVEIQEAREIIKLLSPDSDLVDPIKVYYE